MKPPPYSRVPQPPPSSPRDTLDDIDLQLDAVHERTDPFDAVREDRTDLQTSSELPTNPLDSRDLPTGPAMNRGAPAPWMQASPWANPETSSERQRDPWLLPALVIVMVLLGCIGLFLYQETHKLP